MSMFGSSLSFFDIKMKDDCIRAVMFPAYFCSM